MRITAKPKQIKNKASAANVALFNQALQCHKLGQLEQAKAIYASIVANQAQYFDAVHMLGVVLHALGSHVESETYLNQALQLNPKEPSVYINYGNTLIALKKYKEALNHYNQALKFDALNANVHFNKGNTLNYLHQYEDALKSLNTAIRLAPNDAEYHYNKGDTLIKMKRFSEGLQAIERALALRPTYVSAHNNKGVALQALKKDTDALASYNQAIAIEPNDLIANTNLATLLTTLNRWPEAIECFDRAIKNNPNSAETYYKRAIAFSVLRSYGQALLSYNHAMRLDPNQKYLLGHWFFFRMMICDWGSFKITRDMICKHITEDKKSIMPWMYLGISDSASLQRKNAEMYVNSEFIKYNPTQKSLIYKKHSKIRIGYYSADFYRHATSHLMAGLFELHDKERFDFYAFSFGPKKEDDFSERIKSIFHQFFEVQNFSDEEIAELSRTHEIDIAIDLKGFTQDMRSGIFQYRAAPIQVNFIGYPGTTSLPSIDYIIADHTLIPSEYQQYYSEKIVYLPNSYQVNDNKQKIDEKIFTRIELGLPESAFVYCCFNNSYKINPVMYDSWMRILKAVPNSVLLLLEDNQLASEHLRKEAGTRGIDTHRIYFAPRVKQEIHLARHRVADLFLDTFPCNAHTTASDALWSGLPVLTLMGEGFASRVAASLLNAIELPELITSTISEYEALAIKLGQNKEEIDALKDKLSKNRLTTALYDTEGYARDLENAYQQMYDRYQSGIAPEHIIVSKGINHTISSNISTFKPNIKSKKINAQEEQKFAVIIIQPHGYIHSQAFQETAETIYYGLINLGYDAILSNQIDYNNRTNIILGANLIEKQDHKPLPPNTIIYNLEQVDPDSLWIDQKYLDLLKQHAIWDYSTNNIDRLKRLGILNIQLMPIGYVKQLERIPKSNQDIDVLFYGSINNRRQKILDELREHGLKVEQRFGIYGTERDNLISRSKVVINIHFYESKIFEIVRVSYLLANSVCVVSETGLDPNEKEYSDSITFAKYSELVDTCLYLIKHPEERTKKSDHGYNYFKLKNVENHLKNLIL